MGLWLLSLVLICINLATSRNILASSESSRNKLEFLIALWLLPVFGAWIIRDNLNQPAPGVDHETTGWENEIDSDIGRNPFFLLELKPDAARAEIERAGQRLLALWEIGNASAKRCLTPFGPVDRTDDDIRQAVARLREPRERVALELWASIASIERSASS